MNKKNYKIEGNIAYFKNFGSPKPDEYVARIRTNEKYLAVVITGRFIERVKTMIEIEKEKFEHSGSRHCTAPNFYI